MQLVNFDEYPGHWIVTPEQDRDKAIAWAKRNRDKLINYSNSTMSEYCKGFYDINRPIYGLDAKKKKAIPMWINT